MTTVKFYHLIKTPLEQALPKLVEMAYAGEFKTLLVAESEERIEQLNHLLWTYNKNGFLPHGSAKDGNDTTQPIFLSTDTNPPNEATLLVITNGITVDTPERFERILDLFNGNDPESVVNARKRWTSYKEAGLTLTYNKQNEQGRWQEQTAA